jgi:hypothetical protein
MGLLDFLKKIELSLMGLLLIGFYRKEGFDLVEVFSLVVGCFEEHG